MEPRRWAGPRDINIARPVIRPADIWLFRTRRLTGLSYEHERTSMNRLLYSTNIRGIILTVINFALDKYPHNCWVDLSRLLIKYRRL